MDNPERRTTLDTKQTENHHTENDKVWKRFMFNVWQTGDSYYCDYNYIVHQWLMRFVWGVVSIVVVSYIVHHYSSSVFVRWVARIVVVCYAVHHLLLFGVCQMNGSYYCGWFFYNVHLQIRPKIYYTLFQQFPFCLVMDMVLNIKIK